MRVILHKESGSTKAIQHLVSSYNSRGYEISPTTDTEIYIGSMYPFNNFFVNMESGTENANTAVMSIEYWDGTQFRTAPNITDETEVENITLSESGFISFVPDLMYPWNRQDARYISEISDQIYYDLYWVRLTFSADLTTDINLKFLGNVFCTDSELYGEFYKFSQTDWLDQWGASKTDWLEQRIIASDLIIGELRTIGKIQSRDNILVRESLRDACVQKVAGIIYMNSGANYVEETQAAMTEAMARLKLSTVTIDKDENGIYNRKDNYKTIHWSR